MLHLNRFFSFLLSTLLTLAAQNVVMASSSSGLVHQSGEDFIQQQHVLEGKIDSLKLKSLTPEQYVKVEKIIDQMIDQREEWVLRLERIESDDSILTANQRYKKMFLQTLKSLKVGQKIKFFSDDFYEMTGLNRYLCSDKYRCSLRNDSGCKKLKALYLPLVDQVFLDPSLSESELAISLFHEVQHAFQYRFRFPNDMTVLMHFASEKGEKKVKSDDILSYLSLIYETQSLWYEVQGSQPKRWMDVTFKPGELGYALSSAFHIGVQSVWGFIRPFVPGSTGQQPGASQLNGILPISDKIQINTNSRKLPGMYPVDLPNALFFREVVLFGNPELIGLFGNLDIAFHKRLTQAVECNYYGKLNFLFETMSGNQSIVATAHDLFYSRFFGDSFDAFNASETDGCVASFENELTQKKISPLVFWLSVDPNEVQRYCKGPFKAWNKQRQESAGSLFMLQSDSPFNIMARGVEGGTGGLDLAPSLFFNPQIDFGPLPSNSPPTSK